MAKMNLGRFLSAQSSGAISAEGRISRRRALRLGAAAAVGIVGAASGFVAKPAQAQTSYCGSTQYNVNTQCCIYCQGRYMVVGRTSSGTCGWSCCGYNGNYYDPNTQCCYSCGSGPYYVLPRIPGCGYTCCNATPINPNTRCCFTCGQGYFNLPRTAAGNCAYQCCRGTPYDPATQTCA